MKTALILGAGASMDLGFPSGPGLVSRIHENKDSIYDTARSIFGETLTSKFVEAVATGGNNTVDEFLARNAAANPVNNFENIGRFCITKIILDSQKHEPLIDRTKNWYHHLLTRLISNHKFDPKDYAILTYNYDLSLEYFFWRSFKSAFQMTSEQSFETLKKLEIIHLHGFVGSMLQAGDFEYVRSWTPDEIIHAASNIFLMHEIRRVTPIADRAKNIIFNSGKILFLGFGYHEELINRLGLPKNKTEKTIQGTTKGFSRPIASDLNFRLFGNRLEDLGDMTIMEAISHYPGLL